MKLLRQHPVQVEGDLAGSRLQIGTGIAAKLEDLEVIVHHNSGVRVTLPNDAFNFSVEIKTKGGVGLSLALRRPRFETGLNDLRRSAGAIPHEELVLAVRRREQLAERAKALRPAQQQHSGAL